MTTEYKPYVVSADANGLMKSWAREKNISLPKDSYFQGMLTELDRTLRQYFATVEIVPEEFLRRGMNEYVSKSAVPVVSLDRAYVKPKQKNLLGFLDATRMVDKNLENTELGSRASEITLERQIGQLALRQGGKSVALLDDVIFEGKTLLQLIQKIRAKGITVDTVYAGITIKEGQELLEQNDVRVNSLLVYDQVADEICERDFRVGVPYSGRTVANGTAIEGAPYLYPFGKPVEWASIPQDKALDFSLFCLSQSLQLWLKTEQVSRQSISTTQVAKPVFGLPANTSMSVAIRKVIGGLEKGEYE